MRGGVLETHGEGVFKICDEPRSPNEGGCLGYMVNLTRPIGAGGCFRYMMNRSLHMRGVFKIYYDEPGSPHEKTCLGSILNRNRQMRCMF